MEQKQQEQQKQQIKLDREKTIILLKWLKQGFISPDDMPELREALGGGRLLTREEQIAYLEQLEREY